MRGFFLEAEREIQYWFNSPTIFRMAGIWDYLIQSVARVLRAVMVEQVTYNDILSTLMCLVEGILNSRPFTTMSDDPADLSPLTLSHLLLLKPDHLPFPGVFHPKDCYMRRKWHQVQYLADLFWACWQRECLPLIQLHTKWRKKAPNLSVDNGVLVVESTSPRHEWRLARVSSVTVDEDGVVKLAPLRTRLGTLTCPIAKLCFLEGCWAKDLAFVR